MTMATLDANFNRASCCTTLVSACALNQQEEMATVCGVLFQHSIVVCFSVKALRIVTTCRSKLRVCFAVREVLLDETSHRYVAIVLARSSQITYWCPHDEKANLPLYRHVNQVGCGIHPRARTSR